MTVEVINGTSPVSSLITTTNTYNADGLVTQTLTSGGAKTAYGYDNNGNLIDRYNYSSASEYTPTTVCIRSPT